MSDHIIETTFDDERAHWQCSCGRAGSCGADVVDLISDRHIVTDDGFRIDRHGGVS